MKVGIVCYASTGGSGILATELAIDLAERGRLAINNLTQAPWDIVLSSDSLKSRLEKGLPEPFGIVTGDGYNAVQLSQCFYFITVQGICQPPQIKSFQRIACSSCNAFPDQVLNVVCPQNELCH